MEIGLSPTTYMPLMFFKFFILCFIVLPRTFGYDAPNGTGTVQRGSVLRPTEFWHSVNNKFTIGFHLRGNGTNQMYVVGIAYSGIRGDPTLVWTVGGGGGGIRVSGQSSLHFQNNGNLVLEDEFGKILWETKTGESGVVSAVLEDNGNFVLKNENLSNVWDTFSNPTDTLVVGQELGVGKRLEMSPYSLTLESYGNLTLKWRDNITYWNMGASTETSLTMTALLSSEGLFSVSNSSGSQLWISRSSDYTDNTTTLRRIKLDQDGNLRSYGWHEGSGSWRVGWNAVEDQCLVYGWCGNFGMCVYNETGPYCTCLSANFVTVDPKDPMQGCKREQDIENEQCSNNQSLLELQHTEFLSFPPESDDFYGGISDCEQNCLKSASCIAATILNDGSGMCRFKTTNFTTAYQSITIPSTSYIKVCGEPRPLPSPLVPAATSSRSSKVSLAGIAVAVMGTLLALIIIEIAFWWLLCRNNPRFGGISAQYTLLEYASGAPVQFSYDELKRSTRNFKEKVGSGGFGTVYKGTLPNRSLVAVKKLEGIEQGDKQFRMEVATISSTHHLNLVRLIGFCSEGRHRLLVYEFMKNTSLDTFLFASSEQTQKLDWDTRLNIALGTARGIAYLHEECRDCIIHCDIKPENILLDDNLSAKVSDFGLAKLNNARDHRNHTLTSIRGTRGYLAPEWLANLPITSKSDVFSYGMVLLEIISGKRNFDVSVSSGRRKFSTWAFEEFERGNIMDIVDEKLGGQINLEQVERAIRVSFWCIQEQSSQRPSMGKVVKMLEGLLPIEKPPAPKPFEGLQSSASINCSVSASGSMISVLAASAPAASSSSSADVYMS